MRRWLCMVVRKRKGMALIAVVLISALLLASIIGITLKIIPENKIVAARSASERALVATETGLSQAIFNLKNAKFEKEDEEGNIIPGSTAPNSGLEYLTIENVEAIARASVGAKFPYPEKALSENGTPYVTYRIKIEKIGGDAFTEDFEDTTLENKLRVYSLGAVYDKPGGTILARRAIETTFTIAFNIGSTTHTETTNASLEYGIAAGGNIQFIGNSNAVFEGDIYADGNVFKNSQGAGYIVLDGVAYAAGTIDSGVVSDPDKSVSGAPAIMVAAISELIRIYDEAYNKARADSFRLGEPPFDGSNPDFPNTNPDTFPGLSDPDKAIITAIMQDYLSDNYIVPKNKDDPNYDGKNVITFYNDIVTGKIITDNPGLSASGRNFFTNLLNNKDKIIVYYDGNLDNKTQDVLFNTQLGGTIIVSGDLKINSSSTVNAQNNSLLLVVNGAVDLAGGAILNGNIFAPATDSNSKVGVGNFTLNGFLLTPRTINIKGQFSCYGSLVTLGNITLDGTPNIYYRNRGLGDIIVPIITTTTTPILDQIDSVNIEKSTWKEISYDLFNNLQ